MSHFLIVIFFSFSLLAKDFTFNKETGQAVPKHIGELKIAKGNVFKDLQGSLTPVKEGTKFYKSDRIVTEEKSFVKIIMVDDSVFSIGPNSNIKFDDYQYTDKSNRNMILTLIKGQLRGLIKNKAKEGDLTIKTKLAVMGIRGTELFINHQTLKSLDVSEFALTEGMVEIKDLKNQKYDLNQGERIIIVESPATKEGAHEKNLLSEAERIELKNEENFLPFFTLAALEEKSPLAPLFNKLVSEAPPQLPQRVNSPVETRPAQDWRKNLQKLNEKLKDNQKPK